MLSEFMYSNERDKNYRGRFEIEGSNVMEKEMKRKLKYLALIVLEKEKVFKN